MTSAEIDCSRPYVGYTYAYPHKTAYRAFEAPLPLDQVWAGEDRSALFLYVHLPFCGLRCGFCNLFTITGATADYVDSYLDALEQQAREVAAAVEPVSFARLAIGGGTPSLLTPRQLERLFALLDANLGLCAEGIPTSVEVSPDTATPERLALLRRHGVDRLSVGVQTLDPLESRSLGRSQRREDALRTLQLARELGFRTLNVDLIYGGHGQTLAGWEETLSATLAFQPEELYLYPLYVRPQTGLGRRETPWRDERQQAYRAARERLLALGYRQVSMRLFRSGSVQAEDGPLYCCQEDGMLGLGAGARSYTQSLHYSSEYAISRGSTRALIDDFVAQNAEQRRLVCHGFRLNQDERQRRYLLKSLLQCTGLDRARYRMICKGDVLQHFPSLSGWREQGLLEITAERARLTAAGVELSDAIGPALYSDTVRQLMESYAWC